MDFSFCVREAWAVARSRDAETASPMPVAVAERGLPPLMRDRGLLRKRGVVGEDASGDANLVDEAFEEDIV